MAKVLRPGAAALVLGAAAVVFGAPSAQAREVRPPVQCDMRPLMGPAPEVAGPALAGATPGTVVPMPLNTVNIVSKSIRNKIIVQNVSATRGATGTVLVTVQLLNCTDHPLQVQSRAQFFGDGGVVTEQASAWKRSFLSPRSLTGFTTSSLGASAKSFLVEVQEGT
ncbi:MAG: hypothetical protein AB7M12_02380 [Hyphomonadaceae bacterium]